MQLVAGVLLRCPLFRSSSGHVGFVVVIIVQERFRPCTLIYPTGSDCGTYPIFINHPMGFILDRLCGLVVRVSGYRSRGPGPILDATRFSEK
jgi:hypothetical protein